MNPRWNDLEQTPGVMLAIEVQKVLELRREGLFGWMPGWLQTLVLFRGSVRMIEALSLAVLAQATEERLKEKLRAKTLIKDGA